MYYSLRQTKTSNFYNFVQSNRVTFFWVKQLLITKFLNFKGEWWQYILYCDDIIYIIFNMLCSVVLHYSDSPSPSISNFSFIMNLYKFCFWNIEIYSKSYFQPFFLNVPLPFFNIFHLMNYVFENVKVPNLKLKLCSSLLGIEKFFTKQKKYKIDVTLDLFYTWIMF